jgi:hypothetical protein
MFLLIGNPHVHHSLYRTTKSQRRKRIPRPEHCLISGPLNTLASNRTTHQAHKTILDNLSCSNIAVPLPDLWVGPALDHCWSAAISWSVPSSVQRGSPDVSESLITVPDLMKESPGLMDLPAGWTSLSCSSLHQVDTPRRLWLMVYTESGWWNYILGKTPRSSFHKTKAVKQHTHTHTKLAGEQLLFGRKGKISLTIF